MKQAIYKAGKTVNDFIGEKEHILFVVSYENTKTGERVVQSFAGKGEDTSKVGGNSNNKEWGIFLTARYAYVKYDLKWEYKDTTIRFSEATKENREAYHAWKNGKTVEAYREEKKAKEEAEKNIEWF